MSHEAVHLTGARAATSIGVQPHLTARSTPPSPAACDEYRREMTVRFATRDEVAGLPGAA
jgi:hypothetical protein